MNTVEDEHRALVELAERAAEKLQGTCRGIIDLGPEYESAQNKDSFCNRLDDLVFCCDECEWWHEVGEMSDESTGSLMLCQECEDEK